MEIEKSLKTFITGARDQFSQKVKDTLSPLYNPLQKDSDPLAIKSMNACSGLNKTLYPAQQDVVNALCKGYIAGRKKALAVIAEMGCGKTLMGVCTAQALSAHTGRPLRVLILCPPTLISTWLEEIEAVYGKDPGKVKTVNADDKDCLSFFIRAKNLRAVQPETPEFYVMGFNRAKLGYGWKPAYLKQNRAVMRDEGIEKVTVILCPHCGRDVLDVIKASSRTKCPDCNSPLWCPDGKLRRYAPALYIKKYLKSYFDLLICDEVHQMKGGSTIQGAILGQLSSVCRKTLILTGTLSGGKASDIFYILQRALSLNYDRETRRKILPAYNAVSEFVDLYGTIEEIYTHKEDDSYYGRTTKSTKTIKEKPGISPLAIKQFFIENTAFLRLSDIADKLPSFKEELEFTRLPDDIQEEYNRFEIELIDAARKAMKSGDFKVLGQMLSNLLAWPDTPQKEAIVTDSAGSIVASATPFKTGKTPKDERLIDILTECRNRGRKALVFAEYTGKWETDYHLAHLLEKEGFSPLVLKPTVQAGDRLDWIRQKFKTGRYDCLICQPKLVEVGMNLREFPEIIFYQTGFSIYVLRQASRRSYRPGQTCDVVVRYMINQNTVQEKCMGLIASKLEASLVLEGELSDKGLVALSDIGDNMAVELARALMGELKTGSLEAQFAAYKKAELHADSNIADGQEEKTTTEVTATVETTTTIEKGDKKQSFTSRTVIKVGEVQYSPDTKSGSGTVFKNSADFRNGEIIIQKNVVGSYTKKGEITFFKQPERKFMLRAKPQLTLFTGPTAFDVLEVKDTVTAPAVNQ